MGGGRPGGDHLPTIVTAGPKNKRELRESVQHAQAFGGAGPMLGSALDPERQTTERNERDDEVARYKAYGHTWADLR